MDDVVAVELLARLEDRDRIGARAAERFAGDARRLGRAEDDLVVAVAPADLDVVPRDEGAVVPARERDGFAVRERLLDEADAFRPRGEVEAAAGLADWVAVVGAATLARRVLLVAGRRLERRRRGPRTELLVIS